MELLAITLGLTTILGIVPFNAAVVTSTFLALILAAGAAAAAR
jgi:hypothetical protein